MKTKQKNIIFKIIIAVLCLAIIVNITIIVQCKKNIIDFKNYQSMYMEYYPNRIENYEKYCEMPEVKSVYDDMSKEWILIEIYSYDELPDCLLKECYKEDRWRTVKGHTSYSEKIIVIVEDNEEKERSRFYHELGHVVDGKAKISESEEFIHIYMQHKDNYKGWEYAKTNPQEFFAVNFEEYCVNQNALKYWYPDVYECIKCSFEKYFE